MKNIIIPSETYEVIHLDGKDFESTNCSAAYSPSWTAALVLNRSGTLKQLSYSAKKWTIEPVNKNNNLDVSGERWQFCSLGFSRDGHRALALDFTGKLLVMDFVSVYKPGAEAQVIKRRFRSIKSSLNFQRVDRSPDTRLQLADAKNRENIEDASPTTLIYFLTL